MQTIVCMQLSASLAKAPHARYCVRVSDLPPAKPLRSQPARDRILKAARTVFAREGYERATIRSVAAKAGVHPSMLARYYGSKEQLFAVAADIDLRLPSLHDQPRASIGALLAAHFVDRWEAAGIDGQLLALLRASTSHEAARRRVVDIFEGQVRTMLEAIGDLDHAETRAALISSQVLGVVYVRHIVRLPAAVSITNDVLRAALVAAIQSHIELEFARDSAGE